MMPTIDLHIHTYFSDGKYSPEQILQRAAEIGLRTIALTDHDNVNAARLVRDHKLDEPAHVEVIPAAEFTTTWPGLDVPPGETDVDVLAYFIDLENPALKDLERVEIEDMSERISDCCAYLTKTGYPFSLEDVLAENQRFPSLASFIFAAVHKAYAPSWEAGYPLVIGAWRQVRPCALPIGSVFKSIHAAGGVAVLAHPATIALAGGLIQEKQVAELVALGLDGLEVYHHRNNAAACQKLLGMAQHFNLAISGGSDEHGWWNTRLGTQPVTEEMLASLRLRRR